MPPGDDISYSAQQLRDVLSHVPTPVSVVTTHDEDGPHGTTVSAFASLSANPPLILVALDQESNLLRKLRMTSRFGVNVLSSHQREIAVRCARKDDAKFQSVEWRRDGDVPRIEDIACWLLCGVEALLPGGDHEIVVGCVIACERSHHVPLVYHGRDFTLPQARA